MIANYIMGGMILFALIFNFFLSGRRRLGEVDGYAMTNADPVSFFSKNSDTSHFKAMAKVTVYLRGAGFDPIGVFSFANNMAVSHVAFVNKNYSAYLEIELKDCAVKNIELFTQIYDSKILISSSDPVKTDLNTTWIICDKIELPDFLKTEGSEEIAELMMNYLEKTIRAHVEKIMRAHENGRAPFYANIRDYAGLRNYIGGAVKIARLEREL